MEEIPVQGSLSEIPLPRVLHRLWQKKKTGTLVLGEGREEHRLSLIRGLLALEEESLNERRFLRHLGDRGVLTPARMRRLGGPAPKGPRPLVSRLLREGGLEACVLWRELETFFLDRLVALFERPGGRFEFLPAATLDLELLLSGMPTPQLILEGVRLMSRLETLEDWLGRDRNPWQALSPSHPGPANLLPHERYVLHLLEGRSAEEVFTRSHLSRSDTAKALFALACAELAGPAASRPHQKTPSDFSFTDYDKILGHFRHKAGIIYRYVSKEVGPVAASIMNKALEEVNGWLGPGLPKVTLDPDGCPDVKALLRGHIGLFHEGDAKNLFRVLDEILTAEVLMVKRTLGNDHESALVKALER